MLVATAKTVLLVELRVISIRIAEEPRLSFPQTRKELIILNLVVFAIPMTFSN